MVAGQVKTVVEQYLRGKAGEASAYAGEGAESR
jgi:hypothetical protein